MKIKTYDELAKQVAAKDGVMTVTMDTLRDLHGAGRLGIHVCAEISEQLAAHGLGHVFDELPVSQTESARIYKLGTPVAELIRAVTTMGEKNDQKLRERGTDRSASLLKEIRRIACSDD